MGSWTFYQWATGAGLVMLLIIMVALASIDEHLESLVKKGDKGGREP